MASGGGELADPIVDPTRNVLALVEAANKRQDDLVMAAVMAAVAGLVQFVLGLVPAPSATPTPLTH